MLNLAMSVMSYTLAQSIYLAEQALGMAGILQPPAEPRPGDVIGFPGESQPHAARVQSLPSTAPILAAVPIVPAEAPGWGPMP